MCIYIYTHTHIHITESLYLKLTKLCEPTILQFKKIKTYPLKEKKPKAHRNTKLFLLGLRQSSPNQGRNKLRRASSPKG